MNQDPRLNPTLTEADEAILHNFVDALDAMCDLMHKLNFRWWVDPTTGAPKERNDGEMFMLMVSEISEAMEGHRKKLQDDKLPTFPMVTVELADAMIRMMDYAGGRKLALGDALREKVLYNLTRADHKLENRLKEGGKAY